MPLKADKFIQNRKRIIGITYNRVNQIIWYVINCYNLIQTAKPAYSKNYVATNTTYSFEDYLKMRLVDDYLKQNKKLLADKISALEDINFLYESVKPFTDINDGIEKSDKIDVFVNKLGLRKEWGVQDEDLYLAIECKRINSLADCKNYLVDTQKFCDRQHNPLRIPFEGQIAFIENDILDCTKVSDDLNKRLKTTSTIITDQFLQYFLIDNSFKGSYSSVHKKNFNKKETFQIFHLMFDYSKIVVD